MIAHLLTDTITVAPRSGRSATGDRTFGAQATYSARVETTSRLVVGSDGNERQADHAIVTNQDIGRDSRVWLPGDNTANDDEGRRIITYKTASTPGGFTFWEWYL
jgi:hypothetical protein